VIYKALTYLLILVVVIVAVVFVIIVVFVVMMLMIIIVVMFLDYCRMLTVAIVQFLSASLYFSKRGAY